MSEHWIFDTNPAFLTLKIQATTSDNETFEQLRDKSNEEGEDLAYIWIDEHGKTVWAVSKKWVFTIKIKFSN